MEMPFTRHCGTRIFPMSWGGSHWHHDFDDDEAWKVWKSMESCGAAWVGSSDWANHLQSQVKKTMERRKERFFVWLLKLLGRKPTRANTADLNPLNPNCLRASTIRGQPTALPLLLPKHKKTTREPSADSKPLTIDSSIPFACHAKENLVFIRAVARLCQIPGLAFLQCI